ncbi:MAG: DUF547 domain-containing protein [Flavobacteriales bacterium]
MKRIILLLSLAFTTVTFAQTSELNKTLQKHVSVNGIVNYKALKADQTSLNKYITYAKTAPVKTWSAKKQKAFWMNVYNAYTLKVIVDHMPLKSITDIKENNKDAWHLSIVEVGGKKYTLDQVENKILRVDFNDPRIHVGINCASYSCPQLYNKAFTESNVESTLEILTKKFVNDTKRNQITSTTVKLSEIFNWFKGDFTKNGSLIQFLNKYSKTKIKADAKIEFLTYNWSLNNK